MTWNLLKTQVPPGKHVSPSATGWKRCPGRKQSERGVQEGSRANGDLATKSEAGAAVETIQDASSGGENGGIRVT